jgi:transcriptional regulator of acetoin/glycerol metabolism
VTPLGGGRAVPVDFALVAASHRDLASAIDAGAFRPDLYYRIAQNTLRIVPLRERDDLAALIAAIWSSLGATSAGMRLGADALERLAAHAWPGNFRELVGVLRTLIALAEPQTTIGADALPESLRSIAPMPASPASTTGEVAPLDSMQRDAMRRALAACGGNTSEAARRLGVSRSTLYRHLRLR